MSSLLYKTGAAVSLLLSTLTFTASSAHAEEACDHLVPYLWTFQPGGEGDADPTLAKLSQLNTKLHKGIHRLAAPGSVDPSIPYPFPGIPSAVSATLDRDTLVKVKGLYDRYVLLERSIEDNWKDNYAGVPSATTMQKFSTERDDTISEMNHVAKSAKDEIVRFAFRSHACFDGYEAYVVNQAKELKTQLANAQSTLHANEEIWAHAQAPALDAVLTAPLMVGVKSPESVKVENIESKRSPASVQTMPAIVPEDGRH